MPTHFLRCDKCQTVLTGSAALNAPEPAPCPRCRAPLLTRVFPAFFRPETVGQAAEAVVSDEEASCFFHPRKKAVASCAQCGRFICALCELDLGARRLCPDCVRDDGPQTTRGAGELENERVLHDQVALAVGVWPLVVGGIFGGFLLLWPLFFASGPTTLYLVARHWREPGRSLIPRTQTRMVFAAIFGVLQLAVAVGMLYVFVLRR